MNALVVIETLTPAVFAEPGGIEALLQKLETDVRAVETDVSTPSGRAAIKSLAHKVARSKTALDDMGKDLVADLKKQTGAIDAERRMIRERLDALKDEVRKPLDDYENAEKERIGAHERVLSEITSLALFEQNPATSQQIKERLAALPGLADRNWQEFAQRAAKARADAFASLTVAADAAARREAEEEELKRLRAEQAAREQKARDDLIAAQAAEAARLMAEAKAAREAKEAADHAAEIQRKADAERAAAVARAEKAERDAKAAAEAAEAERQRIERERKEAERALAEAKAKADEQRIAGHERSLSSLRGMIADACSPFNGSDLIRHITDIFDQMEEHKRDWQEYKSQFVATVAEGRKRIADRLAKVTSQEEERRQKAEAKAEQDRIAASENAERDRLAAIEAERQRVADELAATEAEAKRREADQQHRDEVIARAVNALVTGGIDRHTAHDVVMAIASGAVPNVTISY
jgi:hypothetical protein